MPSPPLEIQCRELADEIGRVVGLLDSQSYCWAHRDSGSYWKGGDGYRVKLQDGATMLRWAAGAVARDSEAGSS